MAWEEARRGMLMVFFQAEDGIRDIGVTGVQTCALPIFAGVGTLLGLSFIDNLSGVTLPSSPNDAPQNLGTILTGAGILALLAPFVGGAIGGRSGEGRGGEQGRSRGSAAHLKKNKQCTAE